MKSIELKSVHEGGYTLFRSKLTHFLSCLILGISGLQESLSVAFDSPFEITLVDIKYWVLDRNFKVSIYIMGLS